MLMKFSLRNAKRTLGDYIIYILTVSMVIAMDFALNRLIFSTAIQSFSKVAEGFAILLAMASVFMMLVAVMLIQYMTRFILNQRSGEFGLYQLMGIENKAIRRMYWIEQMVLGMISLILGLMLGLLIGEMLRVFIFRFLGLDYRFEFHGLGLSILVTFIVTVLSYVLVRAFSHKLFRKRKIVDWLKADSINEKTKESQKFHGFLALFWFALTIGALITLFFVVRDGPKLAPLMASFGAILVSLFGLSSSSAILINHLALRGNKKFTMRVIPMRFLGGKVRSKSFQIAILSILFVSSLSLLAVGFLFSNFYKNYVAEYENVDFAYLDESFNPEYVDGVKRIANQYHPQKAYEGRMYESGDSQLYLKSDNIYRDYDVMVPLSDYNRLRTYCGYEPVMLNDCEMLLQSGFLFQTGKKDFEEGIYEVLGEKRQLKEISLIPLNSSYVSHNALYYLVLPDQAFEGLKPAYRLYFWKLQNNDYKALSQELLDYAIKEDYGFHAIGGHAKLTNDFQFSGAFLDEMAISCVGTSISLLFIGLVFALVMGTVLAISISSEARVNKERFTLLYKLGVDPTVQKKLVWEQVTAICLYPIFLGLPVALATIAILNKIFSSIMTKQYLLNNMFLTAGIFGVIYLVYMLATYKTFKDIVLQCSKMNR